MTLSAADRREDCEPWEERIADIQKEEYYKDSPDKLTGSTIEEWDNYQKKNWKCYKCHFTSTTFLNFIPKNKQIKIIKK